MLDYCFNQEKEELSEGGCQHCHKTSTNLNPSLGAKHKPTYDIKPESLLSWDALIERRLGCISSHCPRTRGV